jgi:hypothetical protein
MLAAGHGWVKDLPRLSRLSHYFIYALRSPSIRWQETCTSTGRDRHAMDFEAIDSRLARTGSFTSEWPAVPGPVDTVGVFRPRTAGSKPSRPS